MKLNFFNSKNSKYKKFISMFFIVFCFGMLLIFLSRNETNTNKTNTNKTVETKPVYEQSFTNQEDDVGSVSYCERIENKLEEEFAKIDGVGKVVVIITMKTKGEIVLNKDIPTSESQITETDAQGGSRESSDTERQETTVLINNGNGEKPIIIKEFLPEVNGILIIAEGGDNIYIKNNLINAAKVLLDLPAHKIEVMKMVSN